MNRRLFITVGAISAATVATGISYKLNNIKSNNSQLLFIDLPQEQQDLYDQTYLNAYKELSQEQLVYKLTQKRIIVSDNLNINQIRINTATDNQILHNSFSYSESELMTYAYIARLHSIQYPKKTNPALDQESIATLNNVDLIGGDLRNLKVGSNVEDCEIICQEDINCNGYTYARMNHPIESKRGHCWLKNEKFRYVKDPNYISGIKL